MQGTQWSVGDITVTRIESSNFVLPSDTAMPAWSVPAFVPSVDQTSIAFSALVVKTPLSTILVDPWLVDDGPRQLPVAEADAMIAGLLGEVAAVGAPAAAIDRGVEINGAEHLGPLRDAGVLSPVEAPFEIVAGVSLVDAPGHNFGHVAVRIEDGSSLAIYPGHLVLSLVQVDDPGADAGELDLTTATATRRAVLDELASRDGVLLTTLVGGPGGGVVQRSGAGYRLVA